MTVCAHGHAPPACAPGRARWLVTAFVAVAVIVAPGAAVADVPDGAARSRTPAERFAAAPLDRSTPQRTWSGFLTAAAKRDYVGAALYLDLTDVVPEQQALVGPDRALKLATVFRALSQRTPSLPDEPDPRPDGGGVAGEWPVLVADHAATGTHVEIVLNRKDTSDGPAWFVSGQTVASISAWHAAMLGGARAIDRVSVDAGLGPAPADLDLSTPARSLRNFIDSCRSGHLMRAARSLWLDGFPRELQPVVGPRLALRLKHVLDRQLWIDFSRVSDSPYGRPEPAEVAEDEDQIGVVPTSAATVPIRLVRIPAGEGAFVWLVSPATVAQIDTLYATHGVGPVLDWIPERLLGWRLLEIELWQWLAIGVGFVLALSIAAIAVRLVRPFVGIATRRGKLRWASPVLASSRDALRALLFLGLLGVWVRRLGLAVPAARVAELLLHALWVPAVAWFVVQLVAAGAAALEARLSRGGAYGFADRALTTRVAAARRLLTALVWLVATALVLERFEVIRHVGTGLLASAGVAGIAVGLAAQQTLRNFLAGIQLALTEPIRIGDVLVFEGEWGVVEEISFSQVVIRIWDLRRLVVPVTYLLERPIESWTRLSPELLGTVFVPADYRADVAAARAHAHAVVRGSPWWNRKVEPQLLVTELREETIQLRITVSADDASSLWSLRCEVREAMLRWLQEHDAYPRRRFAGTLERGEPLDDLAGRAGAARVAGAS